MPQYIQGDEFVSFWISQELLEVAMKKTVLALILISKAQAAVANEPAHSALVEPEAFCKLVAQRKYKEAHDTAGVESKLVAEELEYVRGNKFLLYAL